MTQNRKDPIVIVRPADGNYQLPPEQWWKIVEAMFGSSHFDPETVRHPSHTIISALERSRQLIDYLSEDDVDGAALRAEIDAALEHARRLAGSNGRPEYNAMHVHARIHQAVSKAGSCAAWARSLGISKSYAHEVYSAIRPPSDAILKSLGLVRSVRERFFEI